MKVVFGRASSISLGSDLSYAASGSYGPIAVKNQLVSMRLGGMPVLFRTQTLPSITEGDEVAVSGTEDNGTLNALALRNYTTGAFYYPKNTTLLIVGASVVIVIGIPLIALLGLGLFFIAMGGWVLYRALRIRQAVGLLERYQPQLAGSAVPAQQPQAPPVAPQVS